MAGIQEDMCGGRNQETSHQYMKLFQCLSFRVAAPLKGCIRGTRRMRARPLQPNVTQLLRSLTYQVHARRLSAEDLNDWLLEVGGRFQSGQGERAA